MRWFNFSQVSEEGFFGYFWIYTFSFETPERKLYNFRNLNIHMYWLHVVIAYVLVVTAVEQQHPGMSVVSVSNYCNFSEDVYAHIHEQAISHGIAKTNYL